MDKAYKNLNDEIKAMMVENNTENFKEDYPLTYKYLHSSKFKRDVVSNEGEFNLKDIIAPGEEKILTETLIVELISLGFGIRARKKVDFINKLGYPSTYYLYVK